MAKPKGFLVRMPPGAGKTRRVWNSLFYGKKSVLKINNEISQTLILTRNDKVHRVWLRELLLVAITRKLATGNTAKVRKYKLQRLKKALFDAGLSLPSFGTFQKHFRYKKARYFRNLILDEWHHIPQHVIDKCECYINLEAASAWYLGGKHVSHRIYFVSATPVNPVLEEEHENTIEAPFDDDEERVTVAIRKASVVMAAFLGKRIEVPHAFSKTVSKLGLKEIIHGKHNWIYPKGSKAPSSDSVSSANEFLLNYLVRGKSSWQGEYAFATGLVKTTSLSSKGKRKFILAPSSKKPVGKCFSHPYQVTWVPQTHKGMSAAHWLASYHPRFEMLIDILLQEEILTAKSDGSYVPTGRKALVFCTNQGIARGLTAALRRTIQSQNEAVLVQTNVHHPDYYELADQFCNKPEFQFLIATDRLSEAVDLHRQCKLIVHYQIPWSPLVLFQRVGRLTRLVETGNSTVPNSGVRVAHVIIPRCVEEERVHRLLRRIELLHSHKLWPPETNVKKIAASLLGNGPSAQFTHWANDL